jgi:hypothetical protein
MEDGRSWIKTPNVVLMRIEKPMGQPIINNNANKSKTIVNTNPALIF